MLSYPGEGGTYLGYPHPDLGGGPTLVWGTYLRVSPPPHLDMARVPPPPPRVNWLKTLPSPILRMRSVTSRRHSEKISRSALQKAGATKNGKIVFFTSILLSYACIPLNRTPIEKCTKMKKFWWEWGRASLGSVSALSTWYNALHVI